MRQWKGEPNYRLGEGKKLANLDHHGNRRRKTRSHQNQSYHQRRGSLMGPQHQLDQHSQQGGHLLGPSHPLLPRKCSHTSE